MLKTEMRNPATTHIDRMSTQEMLSVIATENYNAARAVEEAIPSITLAVDLSRNLFNRADDCSSLVPELQAA